MKEGYSSKKEGERGERGIQEREMREGYRNQKE